MSNDVAKRFEILASDAAKKLFGEQRCRELGEQILMGSVVPPKRHKPLISQMRLPINGDLKPWIKQRMHHKGFQTTLEKVRAWFAANQSYDRPVTAFAQMLGCNATDLGGVIALLQHEGSLQVVKRGNTIVHIARRDKR